MNRVSLHLFNEKWPKHVRGCSLCTSEERIPEIKLSVYFKLDASVEAEAYPHLEITAATVIFQYRHTGQVMKAVEQIKGKDTDHDQIKERCMGCIMTGATRQFKSCRREDKLSERHMQLCLTFLVHF